MKQVQTCQCLCHDNNYPLHCKYKAVPAQLQDFYPSYLSQHKDNPIKASYAVIFYFSLDTPLIIIGLLNRLHDIMIVTVS